jgi:hypothetical protein
MLSENETAVVAVAYAARLAEQDQPLWWRPSLETWADAAGLYYRGYLDRSWHAGDVVFRLSDRAMTAQELTRLVQSGSAN